MQAWTERDHARAMDSVKERAICASTPEYGSGPVGVGGLVCKLEAGHAGNHQCGAASWPVKERAELYETLQYISKLGDDGAAIASIFEDVSNGKLNPRYLNRDRVLVSIIRVLQGQADSDLNSFVDQLLGMLPSEDSGR